MDGTNSQGAGYRTLTLRVDNGLARIALDQAALGNPFNAEFCAEFGRLGTDLSARGDVRAVLITANGKFFSVGGDIRMFAGRLDELPQSIIEWTAGLHMGVARLKRLDAPLIAAVHGTCMGGGVALVAGCDVVYAGRSARFGAAYPQIGYSCDAGASFALTSRMGIARARRFMLFNEMLSAEEAEAAGIVDHLVDDAALAATAEAAAIKLSQGPTRAFGVIRQLIDKSLRTPLESQLEDEAQALSRCAGTEDAREGILAFVEKRPAAFKGR